LTNFKKRVISIYKKNTLGLR